jgi:hypothetical protein
LLLILFATPTHAVCPVCTVAVGAGVGLARYLHIDDSITGLWIGGLIVSLIMWTINWLNKKNVHFHGRKILVVLSYYILVLVPLYYGNMIGNLGNTIFGIDKLLFGTFIGSIFFFICAFCYEKMKEKNNGHAYFPFQKVLMPLAPLLILSIVLFFIFNY